jgi:hypothetical protein
MMDSPKAPHVVETCLIKDVEDTLDRLLPDYDLIGQSSHQVGSGFGARVEALLTFQLRRPVANGNGNGNGNHRRHPMPVVPVKKGG